MCLIANVLPLYQNHICTVLPALYLFGVVSQSSLRYCLPGGSPHIASNKM